MYEDKLEGNLPGWRLAGPPLTAMEKQALLDARVPMALALNEIGLGEAFAGASKEQMLSVIEAVWYGVRASMQKNSGCNDDIPF